MGSTMQEVARPTINWGGGSSLMDSGANAPRKLIWAILLALTLAITAVLALPHEAHAVEVGDFKVALTNGGGDPAATDYTYSSNVLTIKTGTPLTISMKAGVSETTNDAILVDAGDANRAQVTLQDVKVDMTAKFSTAAMSVRSGSLALVLPEGTDNSLGSGSWHAGLENGENPLTISGSGKLAATGGSGGAGIGGGSGVTGAEITIDDSAIVEATGGDFAAGIGGGGSGGSGKDITISGYATVTAKGGTSGAGIGGGNGGSGTGITIEGTTKVEATGGTHGAGAGGGGSVGSGTDITISGSATVTAKGGNFAAGIGGGDGGSGTGISIAGGYVKAAAGARGSAQPIGKGNGASGTASVSITGGAFADAGWSADKVYGISPASGYFLDDNNEEASVGDYPVRVYAYGAVTLELEDTMTFEYAKTSVSRSDILKTAKRGGTDATLFVEWSYRLKDSTGAYESGTPTDAGVYEVLAVLPAFIDSDTGVHYPELTATVTLTVSPKPLTATVNESAPSASKVYDGTATFTGVKLTLSDVITGDDVVLSPVEGTAASADAGTQSFTASSATLSGADAHNYTLDVATGVTGKVTIAPKPLTAKVNESDPSASKVYDGKATFTGVKLTLSDVIAGDDVSATAEGTVADVKVGSSKAFSASSVSLSGADAGNYTLAASDVTGTVTIKAAAPTPLPTPDGKDAASGGSALAPTGDTTFGSALVALALAIASAATLAVVRFRRRTN